MTYLPPVNGGRINATIGGNTAGAGALVSSGTLTLAGGNNVTLSQNGNAITISGANAAAAGTNTLGISNLGNSAGTSGVISGTGLQLALAGGNNITLSQSINGSSATITVSAFNQSNQSVGLYALGNTTQNSSTTRDARSLSFNGLGAATVGYSNGSIQLSVPTQTAQTQSLIQAMYDGANSITTGTVQFSNSNGVSFGINGQTITASHNGITSQTNQTVGLYAVGNTTGQSSSSTFDARTLSFNGAGVASVGYSGGSVVVSVPAGGGGITNINLSAGTTSNNLSKVTFADGNGVSFGLNGSTLTGSVAAQTNQTVGLYALGNTTQNSSTTLDARSLSFNGLGAATMGYSNGSIQVSVPTQSVQTQSRFNLTLSGNSTSAGGGYIQISSGVMTLAGGNNITLSQNGNAVTISAANGGAGGGIALANSQTTYTSGTANLIEGGGAITIASTTGQSFKVSVPATSSLSASGRIEISTNGSTISIGMQYDTMDFYQNMDRGTSASLATANGTLMLQRLNQENNKFAANITANTLLINMTANMTATSLSNAHTVSASIGVYSDNITALSLLNSASTSWALGAATNNTLSYNGPRWLSFVSSQWSAAPVFSQNGDYVFGVMFRSSSYNPPLSYIGQNYMMSAQRSGTMGTAGIGSTTLAQGNYWNAMYSASTTAFPSVISSQQVNRNNATAIFIPHIVLNNRYADTF